ncbi:hypothetical protein MLD38_008036 [Melastoma candidum]|uniref:Uncharacterized protein n=1 Tax=Melastoma candidum TaxID=119954 RepID=A0ACB9RWR4_9MYRT|nr:hypothetical protein MLD38_008036 [Melastoma candidum]
MKQSLRVLILHEGNKAAALLDAVSNVPRDMLGSIGKMFVLVRGGKGGSKIFLVFLHVSLAMALAGLACEAVARLKGWDDPSDDGWVRSAYSSWSEMRGLYVAPVVRAIRSFYVALFLIQSADRLLQCLACLWIKHKKLKPRIIANAFHSERHGDLGDDYPMVLVQIPMCNEREVYEHSISAVCKLDWPKDRFLVQVLDDSDEESIKRLINREVMKWKENGVNITYRHRVVRSGYKAGNLKSAMSCDYVKNYEFVAMFDADFRPSPDFLKQTVPHFKDNPELGLVQARWTFVNKNGNLLTRIQSINMCFHFEVEQQVNGAMLNFFGFNGTAGIWRIAALEDSGGWLERTTVEDMDVAVRAHLKRWKFIFLNDVKVLCELPESYEAYRKQQHRWHSGPIHLFRLCLPDIMASQESKLALLFSLLQRRKVLHYSLKRTTTLFAVISGLLSLGNSHEWIVTKKKGRRAGDGHVQTKEEGGRDSPQGIERALVPGEPGTTRRKKQQKRKIRYGEEFAAGLLLLAAATRSLLSGWVVHWGVLSLQGMAFLVVGLGMIGEDNA